MWFSQKEIDKYNLQSGDLLISEGGDIGRSSIWNGEIEFIGIQNAINRVRPKQNSSSKFLYYLIYSLKSLGWIDTLCNKATIAHFTAEKVERLEIVVPPLPEQKTISSFLDRQTTRIDQLIEKKKRLLDLLDEQRQAIITRAVTKGIDPDTKMKDSGIEWLGDVPGHWELNKLKFVSEVQSSNVDKKSKEDESDVLLCNYVDVYKNEFIDDTIKFMKATAPNRHIQRFRLQKGDIIITKDSEDRFDIAVPAKVNVDFENVLCGYHLAHIRPDSKHVYSDFLFRWFQSDLVNDQFKVSANGITRYGLSVGSIKDSLVAVPPLSEQESIALYIHRFTIKIDRLKIEVNSAIEKLTEYRSSLITQAVTGKIDVRDEVKEKELNYAAEDGVSYQTN